MIGRSASSETQLMNETGRLAFALVPLQRLRERRARATSLLSGANVLGAQAGKKNSNFTDSYMRAQLSAFEHSRCATTECLDLRDGVRASFVKRAPSG